VIYTDHYYW